MVLVSTPPEILYIPEDLIKPIDTRVLDGESLRQLVMAMVQEDGPRNRERAMVKGMVDGNPPYSEAKRRANKLEWTANLNFNQGKAMMDSTAVPYYAIFNGVENYAECRTNFQPDHPDHEYWCECISLHFHQLLKRWDTFDWHMQQISYWMRLHGIGPVMFDDDTDWRFRALETGNVLAPQGCPSCIDKRVPYLVVRMPYRVHELYAKIKDEAAAEQAGWNVDAVKNVIRWASRGSCGPNEQWWVAPWEEWQKRLKSNDLTISYTRSDIVYCDHAFTVEPTGKISHFIITESTIATSDGKPLPVKDPSGFLLRRLNQYDSITEALQLFFLDTYDGSYHSVRGYGTSAFKYFTLSNRLLCRAADGVFMKSSLVLQPGTQRNADKLQLTQHGPVTWLPAGAQMQQIQMAGATDELITFHRVLTNQFAAGMGVNIGQSLSRTDGRGEVPTAEQIREEASRDASIGQGQMTLFFLQGDTLYTETFNRAVRSPDEEAKRFRDACYAQGVPPEALKDMEYVRMTRTSGYGSPSQRKQANAELMSIFGMLPEEGRQNALEDVVSSIVGPEKRARYVPRQRVPGNDEWEASVENDQISNGREAILASGQNDVIHLHSHLQDAANVLGPAQQAFDQGQKLPPEELQKLASYVAIMDQHCVGHLQRLSLDPTRKQLVDMFKKQLESLQSWNPKLRGQYIKSVKASQLAAAQDQQATALSALDQAKLQQTQAETQMKAMKTSSAIRTSNVKALNSMQMERIKTAASIQRDNAKAAAQVQQQRMKAKSNGTK